MGDPARDEAYARSRYLYEQFRDELLENRRINLGVPPLDVVDDLDEPLIDPPEPEVAQFRVPRPNAAFDVRLWLLVLGVWALLIVGLVKTV